MLMISPNETSLGVISNSISCILGRILGHVMRQEGLGKLILTGRAN